MAARSGGREVGYGNLTAGVGVLRGVGQIGEVGVGGEGHGRIGRSRRAVGLHRKGHRRGRILRQRRGRGLKGIVNHWSRHRKAYTHRLAVHRGGKGLAAHNRACEVGYDNLPAGVGVLRGVGQIAEAGVGGEGHGRIGRNRRAVGLYRKGHRRGYILHQRQGRGLKGIIDHRSRHRKGHTHRLAVHRGGKGLCAQCRGRKAQRKLPAGVGTHILGCYSQFGFGGHAHICAGTHRRAVGLYRKGYGRGYILRERQGRGLKGIVDYGRSHRHRGGFAHPAQRGLDHHGACRCARERGRGRAAGLYGGLLVGKRALGGIVNRPGHSFTYGRIRKRHRGRAARDDGRGRGNKLKRVGIDRKDRAVFAASYSQLQAFRSGRAGRGLEPQGERAAAARACGLVAGKAQIGVSGDAHGNVARGRAVFCHRKGHVLRRKLRQGKRRGRYRVGIGLHRQLKAGCFAAHRGRDAHAARLRGREGGRGVALGVRLAAAADAARAPRSPRARGSAAGGGYALHLPLNFGVICRIGNANAGRAAAVHVFFIRLGLGLGLGAKPQ